MRTTDMRPPRRGPIDCEPDPVVEAYKKDLDRSLIRENLKLTEEERVRKLVTFLKTVGELQRAGRDLR